MGGVGDLRRFVFYGFPCCTIEITPVQTERVHSWPYLLCHFFLNALHIIHDRCFHSPLGREIWKMALSLTTAFLRWLGG